MWCVMPVLAGPEMTENAISDVLAQTVPTQLLIVNQGVDDDFRDRLERIAEAYPRRVLMWSHQPPLPSLAATWNRALEFVWATGGNEALVVNNDVRLHRYTYQWLLEETETSGALFVSAVGVTADQFHPDAPVMAVGGARGGPDFSCYLITRTCHLAYPFDEAFTPAFCEDLDYHRRLMLDGHADAIYSINVPFLHLASATLKTVESGHRAAIEAQIERGSRAHYRAKWGGDVNQETLWWPYGIEPEGCRTWPCEPTTPALQAYFQEQTRVKDLKARRCYTCDWLWTGDVACPKCGNDPRQEAGDA